MTEREHTGYERRDVNVRTVVWFGVGLVVSLVLIGFAVMPFEKGHPNRVADAHLEPRAAVPPPRLQRDPAAEYAAFRAAEEAQLHEYRWIDRRAGVVQIPIERAMELTLERGLPVRDQGKERKP